MRINLGKGICKTISLNECQKVTLYRVINNNSISDWETPKELMDHIQSLFGTPTTRNDDPPWH